MKKQSIIINESHKDFTVDHWRHEFKRLSESTEYFNRRHLIIYDSYFLTAVGKSTLSNVKCGIAGLEATRRTVKALEKLVKSRKSQATNSQKTVSRQKLQAS